MGRVLVLNVILAETDQICRASLAQALGIGAELPRDLTHVEVFTPRRHSAVLHFEDSNDGEPHDHSVDREHVHALRKYHAIARFDTANLGPRKAERYQSAMALMLRSTGLWPDEGPEGWNVGIPDDVFGHEVYQSIDVLPVPNRTVKELTDELLLFSAHYSSQNDDPC